MPLSGKMAERIEVLFGVETLMGPKQIVLDGGYDPPYDEGAMEKCSVYSAGLQCFDAVGWAAERASGL